jgi:hypothetical protein
MEGWLPLYTRALMTRVACLASILALTMLAACGSDVGDIRLSTRPNDAKENMPGGAVLDDTLKLYATEVDASGTPTASFGHQEVSWKSLTPNIVEIPGPGLLVTKATGAGRVTVTGLKSERTFTVWVYPAGARIIIAPRDTAITIAQTLTVTSRVLEGATTVFQDTLASQVVYSLTFAGSAALEPASNTAGRYRAVRTGALWVIGQIDLHKRPPLRDSIRVTVR